MNKIYYLSFHDGDFRGEYLNREVAEDWASSNSLRIIYEVEFTVPEKKILKVNGLPVEEWEDIIEVDAQDFLGPYI